MKPVLFAVAIAVVLSCAAPAAGQNLVQRSGWQDRKVEAYLPPAETTVPWLTIDTKTRLPKGEIPLGRDVGPFVLPNAADKDGLSNADFTFRRM